MTQQEFVMLFYFDDLEPKKFEKANFTAEMYSLDIGYNATSEYDYFTLIHVLTNKGLMREIMEDKTPNQTGLKLASSFESKGYVLTQKGVELLNEEIKKRCKLKTSKEVTNEILRYCCVGDVQTKIFTARFVQRDLMIPKVLFENTLVDMQTKGYATNYIGGMFSIKSAGCLFWNDGGYLLEGPFKKGDIYNISGQLHNYGQFGGTGNTQTNIKVEVADDKNFAELKEVLLDLEEYETEDLKWKENLSQLLNELHRLQLANDKAEQKASESRIDRYLTKFKKLKDWIDVTTLPVLIVEKGNKMIELWDNIKMLLNMH